MNTRHLLGTMQWEKAVKGLIDEYRLYAPVDVWGHVDYARINSDNIDQIIYNYPRPITPLKTFLLPVKQNLRHSDGSEKMIIMGIPACDLRALDLLDAIYLDERLPDHVYKKRRENVILIGSDCHMALQTCHCTTSGVQPGPDSNHDILLNRSGDDIYIESITEKGEGLVTRMLTGIDAAEPGEEIMTEFLNIREKVAEEISRRNEKLPDYRSTGKIIRGSNGAVWKKYARDCVSCGACAAACPTCSCFQLIDRPGFEKVRNLDTCQYPGFERVAAGEDPLKPLTNRFRNRYFCKYVWKPDRYNAVACTGCGRCIDACIGRINKNELIIELTDKVTA